MKLGMHNPWQATIKLPGVADNTCRSVQHSLQSVCNSLRRPGENRVAVVDMGRHESVDECCSRQGVKWTPDATKIYTAQTKVRRDRDTEKTDVLAGSDSVSPKLTTIWDWTTDKLQNI